MPCRQNFGDDASFRKALRDYFAASATAEDLKLFMPDEYTFFRSGSELAHARYRFADAMLAERDKELN